ncbi:MAG: IucA/IucC family protein, partial [Micromonosporaceae bacterium]
APDRVAGFAAELEETLLKDAVAQHVRAQRGQRLAGADYDTAETGVMDGHPYHPAYKSRIGFDLVDNIDWGPEFGADIRPLWLAARGPAVAVGVTGPDTAEELLRRELGGAFDTFTEKVRAQGGDPDEYTLLPVHPWQWRTVIAHAHADALRSGDLLILGPDPHAHRAQQSIRTLSCRDVPERAYVKLPLSLLNTSTGRTLAPHTVRNAPLITGWLRRVVDSDPYLRDELRVVLLGEFMGVSVEPEPVSEATRARTYGTLACIWRESLHGRLDADEQAIPYTGLIAREWDGAPLIDPWVREHGLTDWLRQLLRVGVLPLVHLLQQHGIAFESHAQNMVLAHRGGMPSRVVLRDFHDGVRFSRARLRHPAWCPQLAEPPSYHTNRNSFLETDDLDQVSDFLLDAFFFINLGELALFLSDAYELPEQAFWGLVREMIAEHQARHGAGRFDIQKPRLDVEQLTARRLLPDTQLRVHSVPNPLCPES